MQLYLEYCGWIGSILFAACGIPQAATCIKSGNADGLSWLFLLSWFFGELLTIAYVLPKQDYPLLLNYAFNIACLIIILKYKAFPRSKL
jgi:uncharacterized protein with PQ loop repeat